ncbi:hypothetical protein HHI36_004424 [Cryptolaemus montrouzieri]|uniref:Beta-galactoside alpha-2,6-sialyltransferase 1 n=1 Tax=Cryptolaemus montrouzieri TaxID=559131 RepID=A0ABD2NSR8_9CUCU
MRPLVVTIWVFINLLFFGMCGYMYVLWSQYWLYMVGEVNPTPSPYDQQIYFYNHGFMPTEKYVQVHKYNEQAKLRTKDSLKENSTYTFIKDSKPRFPNVRNSDFELDTKKYRCRRNTKEFDCHSRTKEYKEKLLREFGRVLLDESSAFKSGSENPYNVQFDGVRQNFEDKSPQKLLCELKTTNINTLRRSDLPLESYLRPYLPKRSVFENKSFNSCVIVSSSGALYNSNLGKFIDSHDVVLRFNNAVTKNFEKDVGRKTTVRVLNSQVVSKQQFQFLTSSLYRNITIVAWDPSNYSSELEEWIRKPEYNLFENYIEHRKTIEKSRFYLVNPSSLWNLWRFLQSNSMNRLRRNPPSSGFLGLSLLLPLCEFVDLVEYIPSTRVTKRCHYYDAEENVACTFGVWHPLAAEKMMTYHMNIMNDTYVFQKGILRIPGFKKLNC